MYGFQYWAAAQRCRPVAATAEGADLTEAGVRLAHGIVLAAHAGSQLALPRAHAQEGAAGLPGVGALRKGSLQSYAQLDPAARHCIAAGFGSEPAQAFCLATPGHTWMWMS